MECERIASVYSTEAINSKLEEVALMTSRYWIKENLEKVFSLTPSSVDFLIMVYDTMQFFDDIADGDPVARNSLDSAMWNTAVGIHQNQFFISNSHHLIPLLATMVLKWQASDKVERDGHADARSFVWRAGYYDLILMAVSITHGAEVAIKNAHLVMGLYGEKFESYMKEFVNA